jgi:CBS domain-containing protein
LAVMENRNSEINVLPVVSDSGEVMGIIRLHDIIKGAG